MEAQHMEVVPPTSHVVDVDDPTVQQFLQEVAEHKPIHFTSQQLKAYTGNYSMMLGSGGFGKVYKGKLPNGLEIAVKVLNSGLSLDKNSEGQFMAEVGSTARTHHIHLVKMYGFCYDKLMTALVYEFMENGSLDHHLFVKSSNLKWMQLHEIAIGSAKGIAYLHEDCLQRIIHCDIKPGNVLLDAKFLPKVADFGMSLIRDREATHVTVMGGTPGYVAPEVWLGNFPVTYKCDVYSFGIMLFEIIGKTKITNACRLDKIVWEKFEKGELMALIEACGIEEKGRAAAERMAMVALWCIQNSPDARPPMSSVVKMLEGVMEITPPPKPFQSE